MSAPFSGGFLLLVQNPSASIPREMKVRNNSLLFLLSSCCDSACQTPWTIICELHGDEENSVFPYLCSFHDVNLVPYHFDTLFHSLFFTANQKVWPPVRGDSHERGMVQSEREGRKEGVEGE